jgi:tetratricopeptide (TPR) repeat protein
VRTRAHRVLAAGIALAAVLLPACEHDAPAPPRPPATRTIPLPDLAGVDSDVVAAVELARKAVEDDPGSAETWGRLGNRYFVHDFVREAAQCFAHAEELDPGRAVWTYRRGLCSIDDDPAEAARNFARCIEALDEHAPAHENYARVLWRLGREDEAIAHFQRAAELDPRAPEPETGLGQIALARGELEQARVHLEAALARDPRHTEAHVALAQVYMGLGQEKKARHHADISRTLPQTSKRQDVYGTPSVPPAGARARTQYGRQLERRGQTEEAEREYRTALQANPDYYAARSRLVKLLVGAGRRDEAIELLREAQRRNPELERAQKDLERLLDPDHAPPEEPDELEEGGED